MARMIPIFIAGYLGCEYGTLFNKLKAPIRLMALLKKAGRAGFEPAVEVMPRQPLSRRPQSTTLAPPQIIKLQSYASHHHKKAEGEGFEPPVGLSPTAVFKTAALVHSAIPPSISGNCFPSDVILPYPPHDCNNLRKIRANQ